MVPDFEYCKTSTRLGQRVGAAWELFNAIEMGMRVDFDDLSQREFDLLKIIKAEKEPLDDQASSSQSEKLLERLADRLTKRHG